MEHSRTIECQQTRRMSDSNSPLSVKRKAITIYVLIASSAISQTLIEPILPFMVEERMGIDHNSPYASLIVGIISSALFFGECLSMAPIGHLSDIYGRKWFIVLLQVASFLGVAVFGFIRVWWVAALIRFIQGCCGGIHATAKATLTDISSEDNRSLLLAYIATTYALARAFSSIVGVFLLSGIRRIYSGNPYMVASLIASSMCFVGVIISFSLEETNKNRSINDRSRSPFSDYIPKFFSGLKDIFSHKSMAIVTLLFCMSYFSNSASITLWSVISEGKVTEYGLGFSALGTGVYIGVFGFTCAIFQLIVYKPAMKRYGLHTMFLIASICAAIDMTMFSVASFPYWINKFTKSTGTTAIVISILCGNTLLASTSRTILIPTLNGMIGNLSDLNKQGLVQGSIQTLGNFSKAFGPLIAGAVYTFSQSIKFPWLMPLIISLFYISSFAIAKLALNKDKVQQKNATRIEASVDEDSTDELDLIEETH